MVAAVHAYAQVLCSAFGDAHCEQIAVAIIAIAVAPAVSSGGGLALRAVEAVQVVIGEALATACVQILPADLAALVE